MLDLVVEADTTAASRMLDGIADRLEQPRNILSRLGEELVEYERGLFASQGRGEWPALDPMTAAAKGSGRILVDSGRLLDDLTHDGAIRAEDDSVEVATDHPAAGYLRSGTRRMPRRDPLLDPTGSDLRQWAEVLGRTVVEGNG